MRRFLLIQDIIQTPKKALIKKAFYRIFERINIQFYKAFLSKESKSSFVFNNKLNIGGVKQGLNNRNSLGQLVIFNTRQEFIMSDDRVVLEDKTYDGFWHKDPFTKLDVPSKIFYHKVLPQIDRRIDVKYLWELSRLQFLSAINYSFPTNISRECIIKTISSFIISNDTGYGIHWSSNMDVSIRAANVSLYSTIADTPAQSSNQPRSLDDVERFIFDHYHHIGFNMEHKQGLGNNHYLANLVGLIYTASNFDDLSILDSINKSSRSLFQEIDKQFLADGFNFESSTCYHVFSLEMCVYGMALLENLMSRKSLVGIIDIDRNKYNSARERLYLAYLVLEEIMQDDGHVIQFGDNDSGRFFKFYENMVLMTREQYKSRYFYEESLKNDEVLDEDLLNYQAVRQACKTYFGIKQEDSLAGEITKMIMLNLTVKPPEVQANVPLKFAKKPTEELLFRKTSFIDLSPLEMKASKTVQKIFPLGGLYIMKNDSVKLFINGMNRHVKQYWPHGHNDKLSFEIQVNGKSYFRDPGSLTYTGDWKMRNAYRSVSSHNCPQHGEEQNNWIDGRSGVFRMMARSNVVLLEASENKISLMLSFGNIVHIREWLVQDDGILILDKSNHPFETNFYPQTYFTAGYGKVTRSYA